MRPYAAVSDFRTAGDGIAPAVLAEWLGVHPWTVVRWERGQSPAPVAAIRLAAFMARGELPPRAGALWAGWRIGHDGLLYAPGFGRGLTPGQVASVHWLEQCSTWRTARLDLAAPLPETAIRAARGQAAAAHD